MSIKKIWLRVSGAWNGIQWSRPSYPWGIAASIAFGVAGIALWVAGDMAVTKGATYDHLINLLTGYLIAGLLLGGAGQLLRAAAHGVDRGGKTLDGVGKILSVLGWSVSVTAALAFALEKAEAEAGGNILGWSVGLVIIAAAGTFFLSWVWARK